MLNLLEKIRKNKKITAIVLGIAGISIFVAKTLMNQSHQSGQMIKFVETEKVALSNINKTERFIGTIRPKHFCVIIAKASGTVDILLNAGKTMKKGELLAKIENPDIEKSYELSLSAEKIASAKYERAKSLEKSGVSSKGSLEDNEKALIDARKSLSLSKIELDNIMLKAPFDGVLGVYKIKDGEHVVTGSQIVSFYNPEEILIEFDVPGDFISFVNDGQEVYVNGKEYKLTHIQKAIDEEKQMCPAYIETKNDGNWVIGSMVDIDLVTKRRQKVVTVSENSVFIREGNTFVYVVKDNKTELRSVKIGISDGKKTEITQGLFEGEDVVSIGQDRLYDKMSVKTQNPIEMEQK